MTSTAPTDPGPPDQLPRRMERLAGGFVSLFLEVEAGRRPRRQLAPLMTPMLYARLSDVWLRPGPSASVQSIRLVSRTADRCELVAIVRRGRRCTAVAVSMVREDERGWLVDDIARPETGPLPPPPYPVPQPAREDEDVEIPAVAARADWLPVARRG